MEVIVRLLVVEGCLFKPGDITSVARVNKAINAEVLSLKDQVQWSGKMKSGLIMLRQFSKIDIIQDGLSTVFGSQFSFPVNRIDVDIETYYRMSTLHTFKSDLVLLEMARNNKQNAVQHLTTLMYYLRFKTWMRMASSDDLEVKTKAVSLIYERESCACHHCVVLKRLPSIDCGCERCSDPIVGKLYWAQNVVV